MEVLFNMPFENKFFMKSAQQLDQNFFVKVSVKFESYMQSNIGIEEEMIPLKEKIFHSTRNIIDVMKVPLISFHRMFPKLKLQME